LAGASCFEKTTNDEPGFVAAGLRRAGARNAELRIVEASRTVSADSIDVSALDRYLEAA